MKRISVSASKQYDVIVDTALYTRLDTYMKTFPKATRAVIVSDSNVWPLYGNTVSQSLEKAGLDTCHYVFAAGEAQKNSHTYLEILNFMAENQMTRSDLLIALGGGVVGDISGFAASTYLRGISYIQIPTTLLAMVDSSVGGKTAIDLHAGKNLVGTFYQPSLVLCDLDALNSLPTEIFRDGCAEVIKYAILFDSELFSHLLEKGLDFHREYVISRCIQWKRDVVSKDEFDADERQKLNLGHTIGHSIEMQSKFSLSHGQAVALGMAVVTAACANRGLCEKHLYTKVLTILEKFSLPTQCPYTADDLYSFALSDKKRNGNQIHLIIPKDIGNCVIYPVAVTQLPSFINAGL